MTAWSNQLHQLGFIKEKEMDGSEKYRLFPGRSTTSFWTQILVIPIDYCWQVTYSRSEVQVGLWKTHNIVKKIDVNVYFSPVKMIEEIVSEKNKKPGLLRRFWHQRIYWRCLFWLTCLSDESWMNRHMTTSLQDELPRQWDEAQCRPLGALESFQCDRPIGMEWASSCFANRPFRDLLVTQGLLFLCPRCGWKRKAMSRLKIFVAMAGLGAMTISIFWLPHSKAEANAKNPESLITVTLKQWDDVKDNCVVEGTDIYSLLGNRGRWEKKLSFVVWIAWRGQWKQESMYILLSSTLMKCLISKRKPMIFTKHQLSMLMELLLKGNSDLLFKNLNRPHVMGSTRPNQGASLLKLLKAVESQVISLRLGIVPQPLAGF